MGKVYTVTEPHLRVPAGVSTAEPLIMAAEEDESKWCYCKEEKGDMVGCNN